MSNIANYVESANASNTELVGGDQFDQWVRIYNHIGSTVTNGYVYVLTTEVDATDTDNPIFRMTIAAPTTEGDASQQVVVIDDPNPTGTILNHAYGLAKIRGYIKAYVVGTTDVAAGDGLGAINTVTNLQRTQAASTTDDQLEVETCAIAMEAYTTDTTAALKKVMLLGKQCAVSAAAA
jgi:hypothetical protein